MSGRRLTAWGREVGYIRKPKPPAAPRWFDRWAPIDVEELLTRKDSGQRNAEIAAAMGRTSKAIKFRLEKVRQR